MKFRVSLALVVLICCGCSTASVKTDVASAKWRMENLEQRFLDFRDRAAQREAQLSSRIATLEKELGLPVSTQEEMILTSTAITPDIHVFMTDEEFAKRVLDPAVQHHATQSGVKGTPPFKPAVAQAGAAKAASGNSASPHPENKAYFVAPDTPSENEAAAIHMLMAGVTPAATSPQNVPKANTSAGTVTKDTRTAPSPKKTTSTPAKKTSGSSAASLSKKMVASSKKSSTNARSSVKKRPATKAVATASRPVSAKAARKKAVVKYKKGLAYLNKGKYELARETLEDFLTEYPKSTLVPNGVYWIGESFYSQKDFRIAIDLFREVLRRFPASAKARAAMLKIGFSYERLNEISDARQFLLKVVEMYPKSNEARLARKMLSCI
ncbi:MAG: tol-pal system protein YbgF [Desulfovibrionales bacterium]|nr:tol-pal system protein YbgF [Desulfovibrionales bacterium]